MDEGHLFDLRQTASTNEYTSNETFPTEEQSLPRAAIDELLVRYSEHFHNARQLLLLILAGEDGESRIQLCQDAT